MTVPQKCHSTSALLGDLEPGTESDEWFPILSSKNLLFLSFLPILPSAHMLNLCTMKSLKVLTKVVSDQSEVKKTNHRSGWEAGRTTTVV